MLRANENSFYWVGKHWFTLKKITSESLEKEAE